MNFSTLLAERWPELAMAATFVGYTLRDKWLPAYWKDRAASRQVQLDLRRAEAELQVRVASKDEHWLSRLFQMGDRMVEGLSTLTTTIQTIVPQITASQQATQALLMQRLDQVLANQQYIMGQNTRIELDISGLYLVKQLPQPSRNLDGAIPGEPPPLPPVPRPRRKTGRVAAGVSPDEVV
jgi:hypothetical protein